MKTLTNVYRNLGASVLPQLVNIISNLILPGMIILAYGSAVNGLVSTVKVIISYISLVGAGIAVATTQALYQPVAQKDTPTVRGMMRATEDMFNKCGWTYLGIVAIAAFIYPLAINNAAVDYVSMVILMLVISVSGASEFFVVGKCRSLLYANQKVYVCTTIQAFSLLVSLVLAIVMLKLNMSIILVQAGISFVYVMRALLLYAYVKRNYADYVATKGVNPIKRAVEKRNNAMVHQLTGLVVTGSQTLILSVMVGLEAASIYAVYNIVFSGIHSICSNLNIAVAPFLGKSYAVNRSETTIREYDMVDFSMNALCAVVFAVTALMILPFIGIYTQQADINYLYPEFAILFVFVQLFNVRRLPCNSMINAAGHFKETQSRAIIEAAICLAGSIVLTHFFGMYGVLMGTGLAIGWRCLDMIIYSHNRILNNSPRKALFRLVRSIAYVAVACLMCIINPISANSYSMWILYALLLFGAAVIILLFDTVLFERTTLSGIMKATIIKDK